MLAERLQGGELERQRVRRLEDDARRDSRVERLLPPVGAQTPPVALAEPGKAPLRVRRRKVVPDGAAELEELVAHHRADRVHAEVLAARPAAAVAPEAGHRVEPARLERPTEHVLP